MSLYVCPGCGVSTPAEPNGTCQAIGGPRLGNAAVSKVAPGCCGKPKGCTNPTDGCLYKGHPFKRHIYEERADA